jgi:hypothetical protein
MVIVSPDLRRVALGRAACIEGYARFLHEATITEFSEHDRQVDVFDGTATVGYGYRLVYELEGEEVVDTGNDVFVLVETAEGWQAAWRMLLPDSQSPSGTPSL